jgi:hypothetical protein
MEGSGWNGGVSVDYERLRATLLARSAKLKQQVSLEQTHDDDAFMSLR